MKIRVWVVLAATMTLITSSRESLASDPSGVRAQVHALVDVSCANNFKDYALKSRAVISEWYPKINEILYGPDHALAFDTVAILFEPSLRGPATTKGNTIYADCTYITVMPDDYRGMIIHELTHVVQHYPFTPSDASWIVESIADYVRHKYFEKDIQETLRLRSNGQLLGYSEKQPYFKNLENNGASLDVQGYLKSYTVGSTFLFWLEKHKDAQIVSRLNQALSQGRYAADLFSQWCGKPLDDLWAEFVAQSKSN